MPKALALKKVFDVKRSLRQDPNETKGTTVSEMEDTMPYKIRHVSGAKPWKIVKADTGEVVGSSTSKGKAQASIRARSMGEHAKSYKRS